MKDKKKYIIVFIVLVIYLLIIFLWNGKKLIKENFVTSYLMISPSTQWKYEKGTWNIATNIVEYSMKRFDTYVDGKPFGSYNVTYNNKFYLFNDKRESIHYDGDLIAVRGSLPIGVLSFKEENINPSAPIVSEVLKEKKIKASLDTIRVRSISLDIDNDKNLENIYVMNNVFNAKEGENSFALVFIIDDEKRVYIYEKIEDSVETLTMCVPYIQNVIDIDQDKNYEIIMGCEYFSNNGTCHNLYDNKINQYKNIIKSC